MKKFIALICIFAMTASMTVCAAGSPQSGASAPVLSKAVVAEKVVAEKVVAAPAVPEMEMKAAASGKTITEYVANAVVNTPGLPDAAPIAQGGQCIVNGAASNATFTLAAADKGAVAYALSQAHAIGGTVLNVVDITAPGVNFTEAGVGFYVEGIKAGDKVVVYQAVKGEWKALEVTEVSDNRVTIKMDSVGIYCFIKL